MVKEVSKVIGMTETGATEPLIGDIDNDQVIIKIFKNIYGTRVLVNELICLELAKILELPIPDGGICIINDRTDVESLLDYEICLKDVEGIGFYSVRLKKVTELVDIDKRLADRISNKNEIIKVIIFDHFIHNKDRHDGNMLIDLIKKNNEFKFSIIDHSHVFNIGDSWAKIDTGEYNELEILKENEEVYRNFYNVVDINLEALLSVGRIFKEKLNKNSISEILNKLPDTWINSKDKENILNYLLCRLENIDDICKFIDNNINRSGGDCSENSFFSANV